MLPAATKKSEIMTATINLQELADLVDGKILQGAAGQILTGLNALPEATTGEISFLGNPRYARKLAETMAGAVLVAPDFTATPADVPHGTGIIVVDNPTLAFSKVVAYFGPKPRPVTMGVHPTAVVAATAVFDPAKVSIGPCVVIEDEVVIGDGTVLHAGAFVGAEAVLGADCIIHANAVVKDRSVLGHRVVVHSGAIIGSDGFGFQTTGGKHVKIEQVGIVEIQDDVEIGSCTTIDRARFGKTIIGEGTKIDNLVQIGHNVSTGKHCILVSQTGISGSTVLGNYVVMGGQVGVAGHLHIGDQTSFYAKTGITKDCLQPGGYTGYPAKPVMEGRRILAASAKVPDLIDRVRRLEKKLAEWEAR